MRGSEGGREPTEIPRHVWPTRSVGRSVGRSGQKLPNSQGMHCPSAGRTDGRRRTRQLVSCPSFSRPPSVARTPFFTNSITSSHSHCRCRVITSPLTQSVSENYRLCCRSRHSSSEKMVRLEGPDSNKIQESYPRFSRLPLTA